MTQFEHTALRLLAEIAVILRRSELKTGLTLTQLTALREFEERMCTYLGDPTAAEREAHAQEE